MRQELTVIDDDMLTRIRAELEEKTGMNLTHLDELSLWANYKKVFPDFEERLGV